MAATNELVKDAMSKVENPQVLINMVSRRVRQLGMGYRPLIFASPRMTLLDVALTEIAEEKLTFEYIEGIPEDEAQAS